jgi:hypothetical protein
MSAVVQNLDQLAAETLTSTSQGSVSPLVINHTLTNTPHPSAKPLFCLRGSATNPDAELLTNRYLCRGGSLLLVGNTGIGKSSLNMQMMIRFAQGIEAFGIQPARALKSLLIQGENDEADMVEMRDGVMRSLQLNGEQTAAINSNVLVCTEHDRVDAEFLAEVVEPLLAVHKPDLLWIDPVFQYLDGDSNQQQVVGAFLRGQVAPLIKRHNCGVVLIHHTGKPVKGAKRTSNPSLSAYDAAGSAEFSNWPRAVLSLQTTNQPGRYRLVAGKRGGRLGWRNPDGCSAAYEKQLQHSTEPGTIFWSEVVDAAATPNTAAENQNAAALQSDGREAHNEVLARVPAEGIEKKVLKAVTNEQTAFGLNRLDKVIDGLIAENALEPFNVRRKKGGRSAIFVRRPAADNNAAVPTVPAPPTPS